MAEITNNVMLLCFWGSCFLVTYTYFLYPIIVGCLSRLKPWRLNPVHPAPTTVSIVMVGHQEGQRISEKAREALQQIDQANLSGQVIIVLDGIGDHPNSFLKMLSNDSEDPRVQFVAQPSNLGKAAALSRGVSQAEKEILVFADIRQSWSPNALETLLESFRDPEVGAVSGDLVLSQSIGDSETEGVGLYWKYEKWLRQQESQLDSVVGVTGAICAVRKELFEGIPAGTILDDVYWPLRVVMQGFRVRHESRAKAFDQLPSNARDEMHRKVRTLCGNYQLLFRLPAAVLPWKNRIWWQFVSHKLLRLLVPWALLGALVASAIIPRGPYYYFFWLQLSVYGATLAGMVTGIAYRFRIGSAAASFLILNYAAWLAFWIWLLRRESQSWVKVDYDDKGKNDKGKNDGRR